MSVLATTAQYVIFPLLAPAVGALFAFKVQLSPKVQSFVRHGAAGLVFAAAAVELIPALFADKQPMSTVLGFVLGVLVLLGINRFFGGHYHGDGDEIRDHRHTDDESAGNLSTMMAAIGIDVAVDGLLIGIGFAAGIKEGQLLTFALSVEALFIGLSIVSSCKERGLSTLKGFLLAALPGLILAVMALVGASIMSNLHGALHQGVLAFGIAALLYLVTEELLVEAHESPDEPIEVVGFFAGFLVVLAAALA